MTEQPPIASGATADPVEPKSLPENLAETAGALPPPNLIEERQRGRTDMVVWSLMGLVLVGGVITMVLTWRDLTLPTFEGLSFETPQIEAPWDDFRFPEDDPMSDEPNVLPTDSTPEGMSRDGGVQAEPRGQSDKPPAE